MSKRAKKSDGTNKSNVSHQQIIVPSILQECCYFSFQESLKVFQKTLVEIEEYLNQTQISELLVQLMELLYEKKPENPKKFLADQIYLILGLPIFDPKIKDHMTIKNLQIDVERQISQLMSEMKEREAILIKYSELFKKNFQLKKDLEYYKQLVMATRENEESQQKEEERKIKGKPSSNSIIHQKISQKPLPKNKPPLPKKTIFLSDHPELKQKKKRNRKRLINLSETSSSEEEAPIAKRCNSIPLPLSKPAELDIKKQTNHAPSKNNNIENTQIEDMELEFDSKEPIPKNLMDLEKQIEYISMNLNGKFLVFININLLTSVINVNFINLTRM